MRTFLGVWSLGLFSLTFFSTSSKKKEKRLLIKTPNFDQQAKKLRTTPVKKPKNIRVIDITGHAYIVLMTDTSC